VVQQHCNTLQHTTSQVRYLGRKSGEMTPLRRLNDLQFINGKVYSNIWEADRIAIVGTCDMTRSYV